MILAACRNPEASNTPPGGGGGLLRSRRQLPPHLTVGRRPPWEGRGGFGGGVLGGDGGGGGLGGLLPGGGGSGRVGWAGGGGWHRDLVVGSVVVGGGGIQDTPVFRGGLWMVLESALQPKAKLLQHCIDIVDCKTPPVTPLDMSEFTVLTCICVHSEVLVRHNFSGGEFFDTFLNSEGFPAKFCPPDPPPLCIDWTRESQGSS